MFTASVPGRVGVEIEFLTRDASGEPLAPHALDALDRGELPAGGQITEEPGGQLEISTRVCSGLVDVVTAVAADVTELRRRSSRAGVRLLGEGTDPVHLPPRRTDHPRYRAMESYFDQYGTNGRRMMRATASLQITLESGAAADVQRRWRLVHAIGPALVAAFANSPFVDGRDSGWASARQGIWMSLDPARTWPVPKSQPKAPPAESYLAYVLAAPVMMVPRPHPGEHGSWSVSQNFTFAEWISSFDSLGVRRPTRVDLEYHLTTLFPPVRPRGAVEVRYLDAQRGNGWVVPLAVLYALVEDAAASDHVFQITEQTENRWLDAARLGLHDPALRSAAIALLAAATESLDRSSAPPWIVERVVRFTDEYTRAGRCPGDDLRTAGPCVLPESHPAIDAPVPQPVGVRP
jgi:glutamate--cysteine ligase